jgi:hypothetical protein
MDAEAKMINISRGGLMLEMSGDRSELLLQNNPRGTLKIKHLHGYFTIQDMPVKLSRLNAVGWNENHKPTAMRVAFVFVDLDQASAVELQQVLKMVKGDGLLAEIT